MIRQRFIKPYIDTFLSPSDINPKLLLIGEALINGVTTVILLLSINGHIKKNSCHH